MGEILGKVKGAQVIPCKLPNLACKAIVPVQGINSIIIFTIGDKQVMMVMQARTVYIQHLTRQLEVQRLEFVPPFAMDAGNVGR